MVRQSCVKDQLWLSDLCSVGAPAVTGGESVERVVVEEEKEAVVDDDRAVAAVVTDNLGWAGGGRGEHRQDQGPAWRTGLPDIPCVVAGRVRGEEREVREVRA